MYKHFNEIPFISLIIVTITGLWGGILNFNKRLAIAELQQKDLTITDKIVHFILDLISSSGIAIITFFGLTGYNVNELVATAISGIMAHQGTRAIYLIELAIADKLNLPSVKEEIQKGKKDG